MQSSTIFQLYCGFQFYWWRKLEFPWEDYQPDDLDHIRSLSNPYNHRQVSNIVVIGTYCIGSSWWWSPSFLFLKELVLHVYCVFIFIHWIIIFVLFVGSIKLQNLVHSERQKKKRSHLQVQVSKPKIQMPMNV